MMYKTDSLKQHKTKTVEILYEMKNVNNKRDSDMNSFIHSFIHMCMG